MHFPMLDQKGDRKHIRLFRILPHTWVRSKEQNIFDDPYSFGPSRKR